MACSPTPRRTVAYSLLLLCSLHLQMFGFPKYLWREVALGQKTACIKHLFNEQTGKINGRTSWFAFLKNLMSWEMLPGKAEFHQIEPNWEHWKQQKRSTFFLVVFSCTFQQSITLRRYWNLEFSLFPSCLQSTQSFFLSSLAPVSTMFLLWYTNDQCGIIREDWWGGL